QVVYQGRFGAEPFPLTYQGGLSIWRALPQTIEWQLLTLLLFAASALQGALLLGASAAAAATLAHCVRHAWESKVDDVASPRERWRYRALIAWLHWLQPWARFRGRLRGHWSASNVSVRGGELIAEAPRLA